MKGKMKSLSNRAIALNPFSDKILEGIIKRMVHVYLERQAVLISSLEGLINYQWQNNIVSFFWTQLLDWL